MIGAHTLHPAKKKLKKRLGRGDASGHGSFSTRGCKGQNVRSGGGVRTGFEGGQTPLSRRIPKFRGFKNPCRTEYQIVNLADLNAFDEGETIDPAKLFEKRLIKKKNLPVKILGGGRLTKKMTIKAHAFSSSAKEKIEKAGSVVELK